MSHQDHNQEFDKCVNDALKEVSNESTSSQLDQSILAMAEAHHVTKLGFWARLFRSKQMKYLFSMSAALVMTVGIARFMVYLGKTDQGLAQSPEIVAASEPTISQYAFELEDENTVVSSRYKTRVRKEKVEPVERPELVTNDDMREILAETERLAAADEAKLELHDEDAIQVTGARVRAAEAETRAKATVSKQLSEKNEEHLAGVMDEAIDDAPKPEIWLAEIEALLQNKQVAEAREEWSQFKNTYPEYFINQELSTKLKSLGL